MVVNSQSTISVGDLVQCDDLKSEIESIRQLLKTQQQEIRDVVIQQRNRPKRECPFGFDYLPEVGRCLTFVFEGMNWNNATERCRGIMPGVHLAAITSQQENDAIVRYLQSQFTKNGIGSPRLPYKDGWSHGVWISGQKTNPRECKNPSFVWKTLNGIEIPFNYTNWATGEPKCGSQHEPCVHIMPGIGHDWNDNGCEVLYYPLCEL